jgi:hypothetical protein
LRRASDSSESGQADRYQVSCREKVAPRVARPA